MIDIVQNTERNLKNIQQIGSPDEEDKIYIEKRAYDRIHQDEFAEKRVFVLMGHTESADGKYTTFVEAAIPVREIEFYQNVPKWNNHSWSEVFQEIKRIYEDFIIVGWALDIKGMPPKVNMELESIHREQFGGVHQVLFLLDSLEKEEFFYINKKNHLRQKSGFYVYYQQTREGNVNVELELRNEQAPKNEAFSKKEMHTESSTRQGYSQNQNGYHRSNRENENQPRYRDILQQKKEVPRERHSSSYAMAAAIVLLVCIIGVGAYRTREQMFGLQNAITTMSTQGTGDTETTETESGATESTETGTIPVEKVPGIVNEPKTDDQAPSTESTTQPQNSIPTDTAASQQNAAAPTDAVTPQQNATAPTDTAPTQENAASPKEYTVQKGETLVSICRKLYGGTAQMSEICNLNGITDPNQIRYGQTIKVP